MRSIRQVLQVAKTSFLEWLLDVRQIFVLVVLICVANYTVTPLVRLAKDTGVPFNMAEPFLANINSVYVILILLICWLVLISDYPRMEGNNGYILIRISRHIWLWGKLLAFAAGAVFYIGELLLVFCLKAVRYSFLADGWSYQVKDFAEKYEQDSTLYQIVCVVREDIWNHYTPYEALIKTLLLFFGLLCVMGMIMTAASLGKSKMAGLILNLALVLAGFAVVQAGSAVSCWLPVGNVMLAVQATSLIWVVPRWYSGVYFAAAAVLLLLLNLVLVRYGQIQKDGER